jgi:hypothetical protein
MAVLPGSVTYINMLVFVLKVHDGDLTVVYTGTPASIWNVRTKAKLEPSMTIIH